MLLLAAPSQAADSGPGPAYHYIRGAALTEYCTGRRLTASELSQFADWLRRTVDKTLTDKELFKRIDDAYADLEGNVSCDSPIAQMLMNLFSKVTGENSPRPIQADKPDSVMPPAGHS
jgi:hypothetical protein